jgi:DNA polymerase-3 subunit gamma/tau
MSYTVLARKYRSANFDELIGQEHVAQTLKRAIESGRIAHAYLFCGTRGTGKTSTARILAKCLNCLKHDAPTTHPCGKCDSCEAIARGDDLDVIEIDAASNTGVDNVREIMDNARYRPARSRFQMDKIDEVHMLSKSAFNALLKTLEEPPSHVKFILATTEPEKVLPTILSRCQRYDFRSISSREIAGHLKEIAKKEKIAADDDALALVAKAGAGSMRDALSLLDRLLSVGEKKLSAKDVEQMLGLPRTQLIFDVVDSMGSGDVRQTLERSDAIISGGLSPDGFITALSDHLRNLLIALTCGQKSGLLDMPGLSEAELHKQAAKFDAPTLAQDIAILEELRRNLRQSQTGRAMLDATLVRLALARQFSSIDQLLSGSPAGSATAGEQKKNAESLTVELPMPAAPAPPPSIAPTPQAIAAPIPPPPAPNPPIPTITIPVPTDKLWAALRAKLQTVTGYSTILGMARFDGIEEDVATIRLPRAQETFARQWNTNGKKDKLAEVFTELRGQPTGVRFEIDDQEEPAAPVRNIEEEAGPVAQFVLREFGGSIVKVE